MKGKTREDPFGIKVIYNPKRIKRPDNFSGYLACPFCEFEERDRVLWEDKDCFIVWNKYPPTKYSFVLVSKAHTMREGNFSILFGRMVRAFLKNKERWAEKDCYPLIFRNKGPKSGASIEHDHGQIVCVEEPFFQPSKVKRLETLPEDLRISGNLFAYPFPMRDYTLLYRFSTLGDKEWEEVGKATESIYEVYRRRGKPIDSHNTILILPPNEEFNPMALIIPRSSPIAGIEWLTRVSIYSIPPEEAAKDIREIWENTKSNGPGGI